jgi:hypothetical protein
MNTHNANPSQSELLNVEFLLNSATWEVGIACVPTLEGCEDDASADAEVAS